MHGVTIDALDVRIIDALAAEPRVPLLELARRLKVARGTVQARLAKLEARGVITGYGPDVAPEALGYGVLAFCAIEIAQGRIDAVVEHLAAIPEVLDAFTTTGQADLHLRIAARSNDDLQHVISRILEVPGISRTTTSIALSERIRPRVLPLVHKAGQAAQQSD